MDKETFLVRAFIAGSFVYVAFFLIALFSWWLPFALGDKFMVWDVEYGEPIFRWFATNIPQIVRDAFVSFIFFGFPLMFVFSWSVAEKVRVYIVSKIRRRDVQRAS
jgi:hypothetical protein